MAVEAEDPTTVRLTLNLRAGDISAAELHRLVRVHNYVGFRIAEVSA